MVRRETTEEVGGGGKERRQRERLVLKSIYNVGLLLQLVLVLLLRHLGLCEDMHTKTCWSAERKRKKRRREDRGQRERLILKPMSSVSQLLPLMLVY